MANTPTVDQGEEAPPAARKSAWRRGLRLLAWLVFWFAIMCTMAWSALAVFYADSTDSGQRPVMAGGFVVFSLAVLLFGRGRRWRFPAYGLLFVIVLGWYFHIKPRNDRDWLPDVARTAWAEVNGDKVLIHNVRNFDYRSETDYTQAWEDRTYDLNDIRSMDYILSYWGSKAIAHGIVSFAFGDGRHVAMSIETRKEKTESYSTVQGFFRQYELIYLVADERDVLRLRTNYRKEDVYVYQTRMPPEEARAAFMSYIETINQLHVKAQYYNALTSNCVTDIMPHARAGGATARMSWKILLPGYSAELAYDNGNLDSSIPFATLQERCHINERAMAADKDPDFSQKIRVGLPAPAVGEER